MPLPCPERSSRVAASACPQPAGMSLFDATGARKYLTAEERAAFLKAADRAERPVRTLCMTLACAGCRLSEALAFTADRVDLANGVLVFESLKKCRPGIYRAVPVPPALLDTLDMVQGIREAQAQRDQGRNTSLWPWSRITGWRAVHKIMAAAQLAGRTLHPRGCGTGLALPPSRQQHPPQSRSEMVWSRPALHHRHLCQRRRPRRTGYRQENVGRAHYNSHQSRRLGIQQQASEQYAHAIIAVSSHRVL